MTIEEENAALKDALNKAVFLAREMRRRQNEYFKSRTETNLKYSKTAESNFDNYFKLLAKKGYGSDNSPKQTNLY